MSQRVKPFADRLIDAFSGEMSAEHVSILKHRDVILLSYDQIAELIGSSVGTVKSRLSRARIKLNLLRARAVHPNGKPKFSDDGTLLDEQGNRSIFDDVDE